MKTARRGGLVRKGLFGRSPGELWGRGRQAGAARLERLHLSPLTHLPAEVDVPPAAPGAASWPPPPPSSDAYRRFLARAEPSAASGLQAAAEGILAGRLTLLGFRGLAVGTDIDWHRDPVAGITSPRRHWSRIPYLDPAVSGDHKVVWEINRHQWFLTLGRAWRLTGDPRFGEVFARHLASWMDANPPKTGVNWASSLEIAYRAIAWLWAFRLFEGCPAVTPELLARARKFLYLHGRHVETYLSTYFSPNTHLTGEALGLACLAAAFPSWRCAPRWWATGTRVLSEALDRHVRSDGVYFEQASYYHRYTADIYTQAYLLARTRQPDLAERIRPKLEALLEHLMWITRPDGTTPFFGDDDGGRLVVLDERAPDDFRAALSTGAALFSRPDFAFVAAGAAEETFWILGEAGVATLHGLPAAPPKALAKGFDQGGYYVMRDGWARDSNWLLADCGVHGALNCGHAHADALSIQLAARGVTALVDPGTCRYTASREDRDLFRSSLVHNTVSVDGQSSSVPSGPFSWGHIASARVRGWVSEPHFDWLEGEHDGFERLPDPVRHVRSVLFIRGGYWVVRDRLVARGRHRYVSRFQLAPGLTLGLRGHGAGSSPSRVVPSTPGAPGVRVEADGQELLSVFTRGAAGRWEAAPGRVSPAYGVSSGTPAAQFAVEADGTTEWATLLVPASTNGSAVALHASGFEVRGQGWVDRFLPGEGEAPGSTPWTGAFDWLWVREDEQAGTTSAIAFGCRSLSLDGAFSLEAGAAVPWLAAQASPDTLALSFPPGHDLRLHSLSSSLPLFVNQQPVRCEPGQVLALNG